MRYSIVEYVREAAKLYVNKAQLYIDLEGAFLNVY